MAKLVVHTIQSAGKGVGKRAPSSTADELLAWPHLPGRAVPEGRPPGHTEAPKPVLTKG